jgi:hypothetical protein
VTLHKEPYGAGAMQGKEYRIAPSVSGRLAASFWKFWVAGDEVYASTRSGGHLTKISVHQSGQIHLRLGEGKRQVLAQPLLLGNGTWLHALELRFLLSAGACRPPEEDLRKKKGYVVEVPEGTVLILNLILGRTQSQAPADLPHELLPAAEILWRSVLRGKQAVVLTGRLLPSDEENKEAIRYIREELKPRANLRGEPKEPPYVEVMRVVWTPAGGNVLLIIPMGREGYPVGSATTTGRTDDGPTR